MKQLSQAEFEAFQLQLTNLVNKVKLHIDRDNYQCCAKATGLSDLKNELEEEAKEESLWDQQHNALEEKEIEEFYNED